MTGRNLVRATYVMLWIAACSMKLVVSNSGLKRYLIIGLSVRKPRKFTLYTFTSRVAVIEHKPTNSTPCLQTAQNCFCQNFVKFSP